MFNIIFKTENNFHTSSNKLVNLNNDYAFCDSPYAYGNFSKTNIFIGENNSGKSRFLRFLYSSNYYEMSTTHFDEFFTHIKQRVNNQSFVSLNCRLNTFIDIYTKTVNSNSSIYSYNNNFFDVIKTHCIQSNKGNRYYFPVLRGFKDYKSIIHSKLKVFLDSTRSIQNKDSIHHYISLLSLEVKGLDDFDVYRDIVSQEYFKEQQDSIKNILTGGKLYQEIKSMLLGNAEQRRLIEDYQNFLRDNFFNEYGSVQLIPNEEMKTLYVKIGDNERPIYDWGDGTQQLIIILFSLFIHKDEENKVFFIEEPEMYLHPGILRKFIEVKIF